MENKKGKAFEHRNKENRREGDFYCTPKSLIWAAEDIMRIEFGDHIIYEPAYGHGSIVDALLQMYYEQICIWDDLYTCENGSDYLKNLCTDEFKYVITNPPFSLWDQFVLKAKTHCKKFMFIGRLNYFGTQSRLKKNIWKNLKGVYPFSRYIDYRTPYREDGLFHVGSQSTAWFLWDMNYNSGFIDFKILDVNKWAKLGAYK